MTPVVIDLNNQEWWHYQCRKSRIGVFGCLRDIGKVMFVDELAVRFRVFVVGGEVVGISNKDPERPLTGRFPITVVRCDTLTRTLGKNAKITDFACDWIVMKTTVICLRLTYTED